MENLEKQMGDMQQSFANLEKQMLTMLEKMDCFEQRVMDRFDNLESRMGNLENRMGNLESRMGNLESRMGNLESRMGNLQSQIDKLESRIICLEKKTDDNFNHLLQDILRIEVSVGQVFIKINDKINPKLDKAYDLALKGEGRWEQMREICDQKVEYQASHSKREEDEWQYDQVMEEIMDGILRSQQERIAEAEVKRRKKEENKF